MKILRHVMPTPEPVRVKQLYFIQACLLFFLISGSSTPDNQGRKERPRSNYFSSPVKLKKVRENINAQNIEKVVSVLQNALQKECDALKIDIEYFQVDNLL